MKYYYFNCDGEICIIQGDQIKALDQVNRSTGWLLREWVIYPLPEKHTLKMRLMFDSGKELFYNPNTEQITYQSTYMGPDE